jgi:hypothetical protein
MKTLIIKNKRGGWSILSNAREIGNFATKQDAERVAKLNGWVAL